MIKKVTTGKKNICANNPPIRAFGFSTTFLNSLGRISNATPNMISPRIMLRMWEPEVEKFILT
jgi:hypothetical protein